MVRLRGADPRTQQWNLEDFKEYFKNERGNLGNSKKFQEVIRAFDQFAGLRGQPVNQETAIKMVKANENLKKACEAYVESRRGARTGSGKERLAVVDCLSMFREDLNLDQARDMRYICKHISRLFSGSLPNAKCGFYYHVFSPTLCCSFPCRKEP